MVTRLPKAGAGPWVRMLPLGGTAGLFAALVLASLAALFFHFFRGWSGLESPWGPFYLGVTIALILGGVWAGLFATLLSGLFALFFLGGFAVPFAITGPEMTNLALFFCNGVLASISAGILHSLYAARFAGQQEHLLHAQRSAGAGIWSVNLVNDSIDWSEACHELLGLDPSIPPSLNAWISCIHPDDRARVESEYAAALKKSDAYSIDYRIVKNGRVRWIRGEGKVAVDRQGRPVSVSGIAWDMTDGILARDAKRQSETVLQLGVSIAALGFGKIDYRSETIKLDETAAALFDLPANEAVPCVRLDSRITKSGDELRDAPLTKVCEHGGSDEIAREYLVEHQDGTRLWLSARKQVFFSSESSDARPETGLLVVQNITDRKNTEEALRRSEADYRELFHAAGVGRAEIDLTTLAFVRVNQSFCDFIGYSEAELAGRNFLELIGTGQAEGQDEIRSFLAGQAGDLDLRHVQRNGKEVCLHLTSSLRFDQSGRASSLLCTAYDITARMTADGAWKASEERFRLATEATGAMVYDVDLRGKRSSQAFGLERVTGYAVAEADPTLWWQGLIHRDDLDVYRSAVASHYQTGGRYRNQYRLRHRSGNWIWVEDIAEVLLGVDGRAERIIGTVLDITERRSAEEELRVSERRLRLANEAASSGVYDFDVASRHVIWSDSLYVIVGLDPTAEAITFERALELLHPDDRERAAEQMEQATRRIAPYEMELRVKRPDGTVRWLLDRGESIGPLDPKTGKAARVVGAVVDITDRKLAEERLRESQERLEMALQAGRLGAWTLDLTTNEGWVDSFEAQLLGLGASENRVDKEAFRARVHPTDYSGLVDALEKALLHPDEPFEVEYRIVRPDGEERWLTRRGEVIRNGSGSPIKLVGVDADITDRKLAEKALSESQRFAQGLVDSAPSLLYIFDLITNSNVYLSPQIHNILGYGGDEIRELGSSLLSELVHPDDLLAVAEHHKAVLDGLAGPKDIEYRMRHKDGSWRWLASRDIVFRRDDAGKPSAILGSAQDITERKIAIQRLAEAEVKFRGTFENAAVGMAHVGLDGRWLQVNECMCRITGFSAEELGGKTHLEITHPNDRIKADDIGELVAGTSDGVSIEVRYVHKDGSAVWVGVTAALQRDGKGDPQYFIFVVRDMSRQIRFESELRESEMRFRTLADNMAPLAWMADKTGSLFWYNKRWFEFTGTTLADVAGWRWQELHHPDHVARVVEKYRRCIESGSNWEDTFPLRGANGEYRWFLSRAIPIREDGQVVRWFGTNSDITELRAAQDSLRESEARFRLVANSAPVLIWVNGPGGNEFVNRAYLEFVGVDDAESVSGTSWSRFLHPDDAPDYIRLFEDCISRRDFFEAQFRFLRADGEYRWMKSRAAPRFSANGEYLGYVGSSFDITDVKNAETQIRLLMREVNHRSKNLLTVVQAIARQTAKNASPQAFASDFAQRLQGLAVSQDLIVQGNWSGVTLSELVRSQLQHLGASWRSQVKLSGGLVVVTPAAAQGIGMALHELATNAMKYGALCNDGGRIEVGWSIAEDGGTRQFILNWRERGGPAVLQPDRQGFGHTVIEKMAAYAVGGSVELDYSPEGVRWTLVAPADQVLFKHPDLAVSLH